MNRCKITLAALLAALTLAGCGGRGESAPTAAPTAVPTAEPTAAPTPAPTQAPTATPTEEPTPVPTEEPTAEPTPAPTEEPTPEPGPTATPVAPGTYTWAGPDGDWTVQLRADGIFTLTDPKGEPHTGEGWDTGADGVVTCGPTDIYFESFAFDGGCSRWTVQGQSCAPAPRP